MELLFVVLGGTILGLAVRYLLPRRDTHGVALIPAVGAAASAITWVSFTWLGFTWNGGWIWVISLVAAVLASCAIAYIFGIIRAKKDQTHLNRLLSAKSRNA